MPAQIRQEHDLPFPIERVWTALTDPAEVSQWSMPTDIRPVVGHRFRFTDKPNGGWDGVIRCQVLEAEPPRRLVYSWETATSGPCRVELDLRPLPDGGTRVRLRHSGFAGFSGWVLRVMVAHGHRVLFRKRLPAFLATGRSQRAPYAPTPAQLEAR